LFSLVLKLVQHEVTCCDQLDEWMHDLCVSTARDVLTYDQLNVCARDLEVCNPVTLRKEYKLTLSGGGQYASEEHSSILA